MGRRVFTDEEIRWIVEYTPGHLRSEIAEEFFRKFGKRVTAKQVHGPANRAGVKSGVRRTDYKKGIPVSPVWSNPEALEYIREHHHGMTRRAMAQALSDITGETVTESMVHGYYDRIGIGTGNGTWFKPGHVPHNKGKHFCAKGSEKGWFKKGGIPHNHLPVGTERITEDGYREIKTAEPNVWEAVHRLNWERERGPIPEGHVVIFADQNKLNCGIENLRCVTRRELVLLNKSGRLNGDAETVDTNIALAKLKAVILDRTNRTNHRRKRKDDKETD